MLYQTDNGDYILETNHNLQTIRSFPDPSFPFALVHLHMSEESLSYIPWHWHDELEFIWVNSGTLIISATDDTITLNSGEGIFLNSTVLHTIHVEDGQSCDLFSLRFYSKLLFPNGASTIATQYLNPILTSPELRHFHLNAKHPIEARILQLIKQITQIHFANQVGSELLILSKLYALWSELIEYVQQYPVPTEITNSAMLDHDRVLSAVHYIAEHFTDPITLDDIASTIHLSKSECCRCFKRVLNFSPIEFLIRYRIIEAVRKMQSKEAAAESISSLSASVGFNSVSYFNRQFKRYTDHTPLEYRRKLLSNTPKNNLEKELWEKLPRLLPPSTTNYS